MKQARYEEISVAGGPCEIMRASICGAAFTRHFHDTYTLGLVRQGVNAFRNRARDEEVSAGRICIVNPGDVHDGGRSRKPWSYDNIFVPRRLMNAVAEDVGLPGDFGFHDGCISDPVGIARLDRFFRLAFDEEGPAELVDEACWLALGTLVQTARPGRRADTGITEPRADRAIAFIRDGWDADVTLDDIASAAGASRFSVIRAVSARTGLTPHALLVQERVHQAKVRILAGMPIAEAAAECRFSDQAHLTREIKRRLGVTPGVIRRGGPVN